jgi:ABC-type sulfate/molybdate transport systems ATPase subunit
MGEPNLLVLDEPTNDLDTDTLAAIEDTLDSWPGTLVVVSHDRYLLERVTDHQVALLGDGRIRDLPGGVEQYLQLRKAALAAQVAGSSQSGGSTSSASAAPVVPASSPPLGDHALPARAAVVDAGEARAARKEMTRIERQISKLTGQEEKLHAEMVEKATDHEAVMALDTRLRALQSEREALEEEWLTAAETAG